MSQGWGYDDDDDLTSTLGLTSVVVGSVWFGGQTILICMGEACKGEELCGGSCRITNEGEKCDARYSGGETADLFYCFAKLMFNWYIALLVDAALIVLEIYSAVWNGGFSTCSYISIGVGGLYLVASICFIIISECCAGTKICCCRVNNDGESCDRRYATDADTYFQLTQAIFSFWGAWAVGGILTVMSIGTYTEFLCYNF